MKMRGLLSWGAMICSPAAPRFGLASAISLIGVLTVAFRVTAQQPAASPSDTASARTLGTEGIMLADAGNCSEAIDRLERAEKIYHAPTTLEKLGECQVQMGKLVLGTENLQKVVREVLAPNAPQVFRDAKLRADKALTATLPKLARLRISLKAPAEAKPTVKIDGEVLPEALVGFDRPIDPGGHTVEATAPGYLNANAKVVLKEGATSSVALTLEPDPNAPRPEPTGPAAALTTPSRQPMASSASSATPQSSSENSADKGEGSSGDGKKTAGYAFLGVGAAGVIAGGVLGLMSNAKASQLDKECVNKLCPSSAQSDLSAGKAFGLGSTIGFALGAAGLGAGAYFLLTSTSGASSERSSSKSAAREPQLSMAPYVGLGSLGLSGVFP